MFNLSGAYQYQPEVNLVALELIQNQYNLSNQSISILDVGCGYGLLLNHLSTKGKNLNLTGIENSKHAYDNRITNSNILNINLTDFDSVSFSLSAEKFDVIIFSDVLEHLYDPVATIIFYKKFLKPNGCIIITVPNIANIYSRLLLFFGLFSYCETGVMDKTHIRFFTLSSLNKLLVDSGLIATSRSYDPVLARGFVPLIKRNINGNIMDSTVYKYYYKFLYPIERLFLIISKSLFSFRLGVCAKVR